MKTREKKSAEQAVSYLLNLFCKRMDEVHAKKKARADDMEQTRGEAIELATAEHIWGEAYILTYDYGEKTLGLSEATLYKMAKGEWNGK